MDPERNLTSFAQELETVNETMSQSSLSDDSDSSRTTDHSSNTTLSLDDVDFKVDDLEMEAILRALTELTSERDTFKRLAGMYKQAYEETRVQCQQFQAIAEYSQAELENELSSEQIEEIDTSGSKWLLDTDWVSTYLTREEFGDVERLLCKKEYKTGLKRINEILKVHLNPEVRVEGILLRSTLLRLNSIDTVPDALIGCKEALELCARHPSLMQFRAKANFYQGMCYWRLKLFAEALVALASVGSSNFFGEKAKEYMEWCKTSQEELILEDVRLSKMKQKQQLENIEAELEKIRATENNVGVASTVDRMLSTAKHSLWQLKQELGMSREDRDFRAFFAPFDLPMPPINAGCDVIFSQPIVHPVFEVPIPERPQNPVKGVTVKMDGSPPESSDCCTPKTEPGCEEKGNAILSVDIDGLDITGKPLYPPVPKPARNRWGRPPLELDDGLMDPNDGGELGDFHDFLED